MTELTAPAESARDLPIPGVLRVWDGQRWTTIPEPFEVLVPSMPTSLNSPPHRRPAPASVPELATSAPSEHCRCGGRVGGERDLQSELAQVRRTLAQHLTKRRQLRVELCGLISQIQRLKRDREELRGELRVLHCQLLPSREERDHLLSVVTSLKAEVTDLRSKRRVLRSGQSGLAAHHQEVPTNKGWLSWLNHPTFHDS